MHACTRTRNTACPACWLILCMHYTSMHGLCPILNLWCLSSSMSEWRWCFRHVQIDHFSQGALASGFWTTLACSETVGLVQMETELWSSNFKWEWLPDPCSTLRWWMQLTWWVYRIYYFYKLFVILELSVMLIVWSGLYKLGRSI